MTPTSYSIPPVDVRSVALSSSAAGVPSSLSARGALGLALVGRGSPPSPREEERERTEQRTRALLSSKKGTRELQRNESPSKRNYVQLLATYIKHHHGTCLCETKFVVNTYQEVFYSSMN